jgi:hypothetical protein
MMLCFHVCLHARPGEARTSPAKSLAGLELATLEVVPSELPALGASFEDAAAALGSLPRMYCEPDGSFVWVSSAGDAAWQVDGNLYDRGGRLLFVDLKGSCPATEFDRLLTACGWPATEVIFQLVREALYLAEPEFRRYAGALIQVPK